MLAPTKRLVASALFTLVSLAAAGCDDGASGTSQTADTAATGDTAGAPTDATTPADTASPTDTSPPADTTTDATAARVTTTTMLTTSDGKQIAATLHRASTTSDGAPGVLLIHQYQQSQAQWSPLLDDLLSRGLIVLTIDLRGHGGSDSQDGSLSGVLTDPDGAPRDVQAALTYLGGEGNAAAARLAVIGTSIGANLACVASANNQGAKLAIAVSARDTSVGSLAGTPHAQLAFSGLLIMATEDDGGGAQARTARAFVEQTSPPKQLLILPGSAHGKDLITQTEAWSAALAFIDTNL